MRFNIISPGNDTEWPKSALSIVCLHQGILMHQFIETCDRIPIEGCAKQLVADLASWDSFEGLGSDYNIHSWDVIG
jgi:hypothetical protein